MQLLKQNAVTLSAEYFPYDVCLFLTYHVMVLTIHISDEVVQASVKACAECRHVIMFQWCNYCDARHITAQSAAAQSLRFTFECLVPISSSNFIVSFSYIRDQTKHL